MKAIIMAGGEGSRLRPLTCGRPKPMVPVGSHPILWHIMKYYSRHGFKKFILCTGFKSEVIKAYFLNYASMNSDFTINLNSNTCRVHSIDHNEDWEVTVAYTGELTMTGARVAIAAQKYLGDAQNFAVTYGDGLTDANLAAEAIIKPGVRLCDIDGAARSLIENAGYGKYFTHRLGHGCGLAIHEPPDCSSVNQDVAEVGMCFSVEPGVYVPGHWGARLEDIVAVTADGCRALNTGPRGLTVLGG